MKYYNLLFLPILLLITGCTPSYRNVVDQLSNCTNIQEQESVLEEAVTSGFDINQLNSENQTILDYYLAEKNYIVCGLIIQHAGRRSYHKKMTAQESLKILASGTVLSDDNFDFLMNYTDYKSDPYYFWDLYKLNLDHFSNRFLNTRQVRIPQAPLGVTLDKILFEYNLSDEVILDRFSDEKTGSILLSQHQFDSEDPLRVLLENNRFELAEQLISSYWKVESRIDTYMPISTIQQYPKMTKSALIYMIYNSKYASIGELINAAPENRKEDQINDTIKVFNDSEYHNLRYKSTSDQIFQMAILYKIPELLYYALERTPASLNQLTPEGASWGAGMLPLIDALFGDWSNEELTQLFNYIFDNIESFDSRQMQNFLFAAIRYEHMNLVEQFLNSGAKINDSLTIWGGDSHSVEYRTETALAHAIRHSNQDAIQFLLKQGADETIPVIIREIEYTYGTDSFGQKESSQSISIEEYSELYSDTSKE